ncbi:MAG: DNA-processing protein DprA [Fimbriimonadaceae bacterium]|nr:DNA-processing protein DprA [Fimbriimonadaceae bacterium]
MSLSRRNLAVLLALTPGVGGKTVVRVLARNDLLSRTPDDFLALSEETLREEYRLNAKAARALAGSTPASVQEIRDTERRMDELGVTLVTAADAHFPSRIEAMDPDPPGILFLYGNRRLLDAATFCVLSSRNTSLAGLDEIERLVEEGVLRSEVPVCGHDTPEYQRAAVVPLRWGAPRILVLDRGLFQALGPDLRQEPFRAARLWRYEFDPRTDLVVSPFRPGARFVGINNKVRDRLIASLSDRIDGVELSDGGNMEALARLALKAGRPVRVCDRSLNYRELARAGAAVLKS